MCASMVTVFLVVLYLKILKTWVPLNTKINQTASLYPEIFFYFSVGFLFYLCFHSKQTFSVLLKKHKMNNFSGLTEQAKDE